MPDSRSKQTPKESNKARKAFEDYYHMGPGRSLTKLEQQYNDSGTPNPPTKHRATLAEWSTRFNWQARVAERDKELAEAQFAAIKDQATQTGYAQFQKRIADLNKVAELLYDEVMTEEKRWLPDVKQIGNGESAERVDLVRFNSNLIARYYDALDDIAVEMGERKAKTDAGKEADALPAHSLPAWLLAPSFLEPYRDIREAAHTEYLFYGGRGSTKSSFVSLAIIDLLVNHPDIHVLATRQTGNTLRDSVFSQLRWAIGELGLETKFHATVSPLEIEYLPTGQKIYFRGGDDPIKIKSIKPPFGYIGVLWFEELDQFKGEEAVRSIEQSAIRGGDLAYIFKSFNPPRTAQNWANKYIKIPKATQLQHFSNYLSVPARWLGKTFLGEAEHLKQVNPDAYDHEYMGIANGTGGLVFANTQIREITDEEIARFDRVTHGLDWGYFPDPFHYARTHFDAARLTLYVFDEHRANKQSNRQAYDVLVKEHGLRPNDVIIADSAEPKSIADFREYGANIRGAEKGPDSVPYSMKWLQSLAAIVIDQRRAPYAAEEFLTYELEKDKNGEFISNYPDKNNHAIDAVRYATNLIWRVRGQ